MDQKCARMGTREVTIQVLRVDAKKMTIGLFRQLPTAEWLDQDAHPDLSLVRWGRVRYRIPKEGDEWLLVEKGGQLFRCNIDRPSLSPWLVNHHQGLASIALKAMAHAQHGGYSNDSATTAELAHHQQELAKAQAKLKRDERADHAILQLDVPQLFLA